MVDEIIVGFEDAVGEPIVAEELPDVFDRVELGAFRRQRNYGDVCRHHKTGRQVPAGLIDQEDGVGVGRDSFGDFRQVQVHGLGVAGRQDQGGALALMSAPCCLYKNLVIFVRLFCRHFVVRGFEGWDSLNSRPRSVLGIPGGQHHGRRI